MSQMNDIKNIIFDYVAGNVDSSKNIFSKTLYSIQFYNYEYGISYLNNYTKIILKNVNDCI